MPLSATRSGLRIKLPITLVLVLCAFFPLAWAQTKCEESDDALDTSPPKSMSPQELIQKFTAQETKVREARSRYTFTQDVMVQTLDDQKVGGQFHQITNVSFDEKGNRVEKVTFSEVSTLRDIRMSDEDFDDIRIFMPWILAADQVPDYKLTYAGKQHVDDIDTYVFHVEPLKLEKNKRYFQGRIWVDDRDLQVAKLCGKSVALEVRKKKKNEPVDVRPTFVGFRQIIDGNWFPVYARVDETLQFGVSSVHLREIVKFKDYKPIPVSGAEAKP